MARNADYQFVTLDADELIARMTGEYESMTGTTLRPASPEHLMIRFFAWLFLQGEARLNYIGNQNIPSRAVGANLDALGELFFATERPRAQAAVCMERFYISESQESAVLIPKGTRVTDASGVLVWETAADAYVEIGATYADVQIRCQTAGAVGNGYVAGQINTFVDLYDYCERCENITTSDDGADEASDEEYYELMRSSMDGYSTAGARGSYIYWAKKVSTKIADVVANSPSAGVVKLYVLMDDGTLAAEEIKRAVLEACSDETRRPLTDKVETADADTVTYDITFTYYTQSDSEKSATAVKNDVDAAVQRYVAWQCGRFGRDINPDRLRQYLFDAGIKRVEMTAPEFQVLHTGNEVDEETFLAKYTPQIAKAGQISVTNGGYEDE